MERVCTGLCNISELMHSTPNILHHLAKLVYVTNYECLALEIVGGELYPASALRDGN